MEIVSFEYVWLHRKHSNKRQCSLIFCILLSMLSKHLVFLSFQIVQADTSTSSISVFCLYTSFLPTLDFTEYNYCMSQKNKKVLLTHSAINYFCLLIPKYTTSRTSNFTEAAQSNLSNRQLIYREGSNISLYYQK